MPRILVLSASAGAGHLRAAEAVELALRELAPGAEVRNVDVLSLTGPLFRRLYGKAYLDLVNLAPHLLGAIYDVTDAARTPTRAGDRLRRMSQHVHLRRVIGLIEEGWDCVVNTHFLPAQVVSLMRRRPPRRRVRHATVVTDFDAHAFWVNRPTDRYFVASEEAALSLAHWGVEPRAIERTGIPIHPVFATAKSPAECRARHGLEEGRPVLLLLGGGFGVGPVEKVYRGLLGIERPVQVVAVAGRNAALRARLERVPVPERHRAVVMGFTDRIDELMGAAEVVVTKPGGLTVSECLARGAAVCIINPIPGQESRNSDFLLERGAAVKVNGLASLAWKVGGLLGDGARLERVRASAAELGRARAAFDVAGRVLEMARGG